MPGGTMPQGFFQFCRRLSQNLKKAGLCPDISIRASGESSATDLSVILYGLITGPIESLWQRFHSMVRIRTGT
ncbi:hypothetical protein E0I74_03580 [Rhizobium laguerreae]|uniref:Uncharacterized protein n=1 Tax=Rhizobium laguerreae TaxID=1076926 RepID=A0ABR6G7L6_9HYPH|nr:hypothetical protein [Rhizobium laguerreae]MBB3162262.1 hypothetical protein [Rhizobium laguerreae]MBY3090448.1 hypothetical protein [Rhizobium laguerreae]MBY3124765.1 hypothetical protein [Rhizobium laguerreae]MBY3253368.1 hypothetical protein [Rhizobium laguerreae]MBY3275289.1 hypothetical protein [Rhizobium laguerreae]